MKRLSFVSVNRFWRTKVPVLLMKLTISLTLAASSMDGGCGTRCDLVEDVVDGERRYP